MELKMTNQIKFGINFKGHWDTYTHSEVANFIECADGMGDKELKDRYISFLAEHALHDFSNSTCDFLEYVFGVGQSA